MDYFGSACGLFDGVLNSRGGFVICIGKYNVSNRAACLLGGAKKRDRGRDNEGMSPSKACQFADVGGPLRCQQLEYLPNSGSCKGADAFFFEQQFPLPSRKGDIEAGEETFYWLGVQRGCVCNVGDKLSFGEPEAKGVFRDKAKRGYQVHGQIRDVLEPKYCLLLGGGKFRDEMLGNELWSGKDGGTRLNGNAFSSGGDTQCTDASVAHVFNAEGKALEKDAFGADMLSKSLTQAG